MGMASPQEIPQLATELYDMAKEYLRQETLEPAKRLGRHAGLGLGGAMLMATGAFLLVLGAYFGIGLLFPEGEWWEVLTRFLTAVAAALAAVVVAWRIGAPNAD